MKPRKIAKSACFSNLEPSSYQNENVSVDHHPNKVCCDGECKENSCAVNHFNDLINKCESLCQLSENTQIESKKWAKIERKIGSDKTRKEYAKVIETHAKLDFINHFKKQLKKFIKHHLTERLQHKKRKRLIGDLSIKTLQKSRENERKDDDDEIQIEEPESEDFCLNEESLFFSIDYIANIPCVNKENIKSSFFTQPGVTYFEIYQIHLVNGKLIQLQISNLLHFKQLGFG